MFLFISLSKTIFNYPGENRSLGRRVLRSRGWGELLVLQHSHEQSIYHVLLSGPMLHSPSRCKKLPHPYSLAVSEEKTDKIMQQFPDGD